MCNQLMSVPATAQIGTVGVTDTNCHPASRAKGLLKLQKATTNLSFLFTADPHSLWLDFELSEDTIFVFKAYILPHILAFHF